MIPQTMFLEFRNIGLQAFIYRGNHDLARPEGFEPPTPRSVVWCSVQLSYGRVMKVKFLKSWITLVKSESRFAKKQLGEERI
jgi:hypothetical protein